MPPKAETWGSARYVELAEQWRAARGALTAKGVERSILDTWLACRRREFAIETGEIEGLYTLKRGSTEQLIAEGKARLKRIQVQFKSKGMYKIESNNPKRADGVVYEYCPPEHVRAEMDRRFDLYAAIRGRMYPADRGDLRMFVEFLADLAGISIRSAISAAGKALAGRNRMVHGNGGVTADGRYYPPEDPCAGA